MQNAYVNLTCPGKISVMVIEVYIIVYTGEDDIKQLENFYERVAEETAHMLSAVVEKFWLVDHYFKDPENGFT